tara:strand:+ start:5315 stop:6715 length:1401 start_codon:yes stop_codon:yes gene_type:complete
MASTRLTRTFSGNGDRQKFTFSAWIKRTTRAQSFLWTAGSYSSSSMTQWLFDSDGTLGLYDYNSSGSLLSGVVTDRQFLDTNAWYHIVIRVDTTQSTAADRIRIYVNGVQETSFSSTNYPGQNNNYIYSESITAQYIGQRADQGNTSSFEGIMSHIHWTDGYSYDASSFGETDSTTGEWKIITSPSVTYGTNGYFILKDGNSVTDQSGNTNNFTVSGTLTNTEDCPSNNFCVLNALQRSRMTSDSSSDYIKGGATTFDTTSDNALKSINNGTIGAASGKWYWEAKVITNTRMQIGISSGVEQKFPQAYYDETEYTAMTLNLNGTFTGRYTGSASDEFGTGTANTTNDILGFALDMDNKALYVHKDGVYLSNGSAVGVPTSGSSRTGSLIEGLAGSRDDYVPDGVFMFPVIMDLSTTGTTKVEFNFGNGFFGTTEITSAGTNASNLGRFEYDVPTGYTALCTKGLNL